jgi:Domain of unknown function (DUF4276)
MRLEDQVSNSDLRSPPRVCIVCEGQTEVQFVIHCLAPYLFAAGVFCYPSLIKAPSGNHRGGRVTIDRLANLVACEYHKADRITTLVDFYGFQDRGGRSKPQLEAAIQSAIKNKIERNGVKEYAERFVLPYVQMHEFEALLFTNPLAFDCLLDGWNDATKASLVAVSEAFKNPEEINDSPETAPSKRIEAIFKKTYTKTEHGPLIINQIGIDSIREKCPLFNEWIAQLQAWGTHAAS